MVGLLNRGMLEPAQAAMCGMAFGMPNANNFDIGEGCAAYIRAVEVRSPGWLGLCAALLPVLDVSGRCNLQAGMLRP